MDSLILSYRGRTVTAANFNDIRALQCAHPDLIRRAFFQRLCEHWHWRQPNRALRDMLARSLLLVLRHEGLIRAGAVPHLQVCEDGWDAWEAAQRAGAASAFTPEPEAGPGPSEPVPGKAARERRRGQRPTHTEDPGH